MPKYNFSERFQKLTSLDEIRLLKFLEITQYCTVFMISVIIVAHVLDKYYFANVVIDDMKEKSLVHFIQICILIIFETIVLTIIIFYIHKIVKLVPPIASNINPKFKSYTTFEYVVHIALIYIFFELMPKFRERFAILGQYFA